MAKNPEAQFCSDCAHFSRTIQEMPCKVGYLHYKVKGYNCPYFQPKADKQEK